MTLAGYVGGEPHWEVFEEQWAAVLDRFEVPYFHMKEFGDPNGVYQKWLPAKDHYEEIKVFMAGLARAIGRSQLKGFGSILRLNDLDRFNAEKGQSLEPYPLAAYANMVWIGNANPKSVINLTFDKRSKSPQS